MNGEEILFLNVALSLLSGFETTSINHDFLDCLLHVTAAGVFFRQFYFLCLLINLIRAWYRVGILCVACLCLLTLFHFTPWQIKFHAASFLAKKLLFSFNILHKSFLSKPDFFRRPFLLKRHTDFSFSQFLQFYVICKWLLHEYVCDIHSIRV